MSPKRSVQDLAALGGAAAFANPIPVGQLYLPAWDDFEEAFRGIFRRRYFTNNGPLVRELDERVARYLGVRQAVCVTNGTLALMLAARSLDLQGEVIVPAYTFPATVQALSWAGLTPVLCDVDRETHTLSAELVEPLIGPATSGVLGVHLWGRACDPRGLAELCSARGLSLFFDAAHAMGCGFEGRLIGGLGRVEVFSFHATKIVNGTEGGCLTTDDDALGERLRTMRNFHVSKSAARVPLRMNAKMSEAQAAMALLGLKNIPENVTHNARVRDIYARGASRWAGVRMIDTVAGETSNHGHCILDVDATRAGLTRDELFEVLRAEGVLARRYFHPGVHRMQPYARLYPDVARRLANTEHLCASVLQLPVGADVTDGAAEQIVEIVDFVLQRADEISGRLRGADSAS